MSYPPKRLKVATPAALGFPENYCPPIEWDKCCLCQTELKKPLVCPAENPNNACRNAGYLLLGKNLAQFESLGLLPPNLLNDYLKSKGNFEDTFIYNNAKWHKSCYLKYNNTNLEAVKMKKAEFEESNDAMPTIMTSASAAPVDTMSNVCFLCKENSTRKEPLKNVATLELDLKVRECAITLSDTELLATLSSGDLVARKAKYHLRCLSNLYNRRRAHTTGEVYTAANHSEKMCTAMTFGDLAEFIQGKLESEDAEYVFKMSDLASMYGKRLAQLLGTDKIQVHSSRLREKIQLHFPMLRSNKQGRECILLRENADILSNAVSEDFDLDCDSLTFFRFARPLRKEMSQSSVVFRGTFEQGSQEESVPSALLAVVSTLLYGCCLTGTGKATQPALTISQLIMLNRHERPPKGDIVRHNNNQEPPLPLYLALSAYGKNRDKTSTNEMHSQGLSVSYNRVQEITSALCTLVTNRAREEGILCPLNLRNGVFTVGAYDNIDHNPSSTTAQGSFHGTSISVFQMPTPSNPGEIRSVTTVYTDIDQMQRGVPNLLDDYSVVKNIVMNKRPETPACSGDSATLMFPSGSFNTQWKAEYQWMQHVDRHLLVDGDPSLDLSWAAFHASENGKCEVGKQSIGALLPLFYEESSSPSMVCHGIEIISKITSHVNSGQITVVFFDQPLYAISKLAQWNWPGRYGEDKFVTMFAPFHIEQSFLRVIGQFMDGCGWTSVLANSGIWTESAAESFLKVTHVTRARAAHQTTVCVLHSILRNAYDSCAQETSFEAWVNKQAKSCPTFKFWHLVLNLEILLLSFVRSIREGDYAGFKKTLKAMIPWFFVMDHQNYARWLAIHVKDLEELDTVAPEIHREFTNGNFVVRKTSRPFSALAVDQAHEQHNALIKEEGAAIGLTQDPSSLRRWTMGGPELTRLLEEYQGSCGSETNDSH